ncbi:MAG: PQQ-dependent sugar dehydrogenase [Gordonia sp. (in: high G+C Gram-positive bacteria)]
MRFRRCSPSPRRRSRRAVAILFTVCVIVAAVTGCADFSRQDSEREAGPFSENTETFRIPSTTPPPESPESTEPEEPPTGPCIDPDPAVIATCLASTGGLRPGDDLGEITVVAERSTGKIVTTKRYGPQKTVATFDVDASGDGGLIDFAFSPTYAQDQLIYALITTPSDNRVVRLAPGDVAKPILTGIPKGPTGNMGALRFVSENELLVATGNAGNAGAASDPGSLAGKLLSVTSLTSGTSARPKVLVSGLGSNVALCTSGDGATVYLTDQTPTEDRLQAVADDGPTVLWTWPDRPQVAGCAVTQGQVFVTTTRTKHIEALQQPTSDQPTATAPTVVLKDRFGALGRISALDNGVMQVATVNKQSGQAAPTDDRVFRFMATPAADGRD